MTQSYEDVGAAVLPISAMVHLAALRCEPGVQVAPAADRLWVRFAAGNARVLRCLMPITGVAFFAIRHGVWRRFGSSLPAFDIPDNLPFAALHHVLFPVPVLAIPAADGAVAALRLTLEPDAAPRPTTGLLCRLDELLGWADNVSGARLEPLRGVVREHEILVLTGPVPPIIRGERFWGTTMLVPLGFCPKPNLPASALRDAAGVSADELLMLRHDRFETVPCVAIAQLSRAALRLAAGGAV